MGGLYIVTAWIFNIDHNFLLDKSQTKLKIVTDKTEKNVDSIVFFFRLVLILLKANLTSGTLNPVEERKGLIGEQVL